MTDPPSTTLKRRDVYPEPIIDGRPARNGAVGRFRRGIDRLLVSQGERQEAELERRIRTQPGGHATEHRRADQPEGRRRQDDEHVPASATCWRRT